MNILSLIKVGLFSSITLIFALSISTSSASKLYKWVDSQGRISYQDKPPPENSKILSEKTLKGKKSDKPESNSSSGIAPIDVYVTKSCPSCETTIEILEDWGVAYTEKAIEEHRDIQTRLLELTDGVNVPALFFGTKFLDDISTTTSLRESLEETGHLKPEAPEITDTVE